MLSKMLAVVTPQAVIGGCMDAAQATSLGRGSKLVNGLRTDHFTFVVRPEDYADLSNEMQGTLDNWVSSDFSPTGSVTMGLQRQADSRSLDWYYGNPLLGLAVVTAPSLPLQPGGGFVSVTTPSLNPSYRWLQAHGVQFEMIELYGKLALWVPLHTPDYGVGDGYYALAVVTESLFETARRL